MAGHFGPHDFGRPHADDRPRPCTVAGCPVVREGRRTNEPPRATARGARVSIRRSERSGLFVATVYGPAPYGGSISLAHTNRADAERWAIATAERWATAEEA